MTADQLEQWLHELKEQGRLADFYRSAIWKRTRTAVLHDHKHECQQCKKRGRYTLADTVHHVQYLERHPRLALSRLYTYEGKEYINLLPVCHQCHEEIHNHRRKKQRVPVTQERW